MSNLKSNVVDVSRLYTLRSYSETFEVPYATLYGRYVNSLCGKTKNPLHIITVNGVDLIFVSEKDEKELRDKMESKKTLKKKVV